MSEIENRSLNGHKLVDETAREMLANGVSTTPSLGNPK